MQTIGIVGAGVMGKGVAERMAQYGYRVCLMDRDPAVTDSALKMIQRSIRYRSMMDKTLDANAMLDCITVTNDMADLADADFVVENVTEQEAIKRQVYAELEQYCKPNCIYLVNTSCIPITRLGAGTGRPDKVIGVHFMNPVPVKKFAEVIRGWETSEETIETVRKLLESVNIACEVVNDSAGFVSNRLSHLFMNEAAFLVYENVATAKQIDTIFKQAFGHEMGPLETADLIGIDTVVDSLEVLYQEYEDSKFRVCPLLRRMTEVGKTGRKSGEGFYNYGGKKRK